MRNFQFGECRCSPALWRGGVKSGGVTRDLPQVLTITGNRFAFDNAGFAPAAGTVYVASTNPVLRLNWASNQALVET